MARSRELFTTVGTQGGLLPSELLARIVAGDGELKGLRPEDYHLAAGERIREMANRSWNRLVGAWAAFAPVVRERRDGDPLTGPTRERWLQVLFQELGFGRLPQSRAVEVDGRSYPVFAIWGGDVRVPLHLVGAGIDLDRRTAGVAGAARTSPHSLVQELLNAWSEALWGVVTNGLRLRLLRDNASLTRQAFVEFDLEAMMEGEVYSDFLVLWSLLHESRFEAARPDDCWLERWARTAEEQGTRALDHLRDGVQRAITALGQGFLAHPANGELRGRLRSGEIGAQDYYRLTLRLVYRLLFLLVAEARDLLLLPGAPPAARDRYLRFYSMGRLRRLAERRRGARHGDLWQALLLVMSALDERGEAALGLPALGSLLWAPEAIAVLGQCRLANSALLDAVRALCFVEVERGPRRPVDYRNLGPEELGSVYESLLELHPELNADAGTFALESASGNERKTTGSYYTPTSLITSLLETALDPVLEEAARKDDPEPAILALRVVDPACGSGHFLLAAAQRIARRLAAVRTGDAEPAPAALRTAVRDVIGHCLCAVDVNPMAVELCKVSLWMEALEPGRPLSFLDHRIQCGHSLLGTTPRLLAEGVPDDAFRPIEGDDKKEAAHWRRRNRAEVSGQQRLPLEEQTAGLQASLTSGMRHVLGDGEESAASERQRERRYLALRESPEMRRARLAADAWCAAFVAPKREGEPMVTEDVVRRLASEPERVPASVRERVEELAEQYHFFHWHLGFPDVFRAPGPGEAAENAEMGWSGGFDVVLGNPPWDQLQLDDREFFAITRRDIAEQPTMAKRKRAITALAGEDSDLYQAYMSSMRTMQGVQHFIHGSGAFPLSSYGRLNLAPLFVELARHRVCPTGRVGLIAPTGLATDSFNQYLFRSIIDSQSLASLYDFENAEPLFPHVHRSYKFCLLTMTGSGWPVREGGEFCFFAHRVGDLADPERRFRLRAEDFRLFNPNTRTCPIFRTRRDAEITRRIYERVPVLIDSARPDGNPWGVRFQLMFMMNTDSGLFRTRGELEATGWSLHSNVFQRGEERYLPLYEGKMFHHFDHRWATFEDGEWRELTPAEKADPHRLALPRYWVPAGEVGERLGAPGVGWLLAWRDVTNTTNERTIVDSGLPLVGAGNNAPLAFSAQDVMWALPASLSTFTADFAARSKAGGMHLNFFIFEQLPLPTPQHLEAEAAWAPGMTVEGWLAPRVAELACTAVDMQPLAHALGYDHAPFRWDEGRRELIRAELDAAFFHLYGLPRDDVEYVMGTFPIVERKDRAAHGEYRTKRLILERYDALAEAIATGTPYQTVLDPPPADPRVTHQML